MSSFFFFNIYLLFIYFIIIYFWLHQVLVAACGTFVEACELFVAVHRLLSSCDA